jgi:hypothetical protein
MEPTKERLAKALDTIGAPDLAVRARTGEFSDFESPHAMPKILLVDLLRQRGLRHKALNDLAQRIVMGDFDDTKQEGEEWWRRAGRHMLGTFGADKNV